MWSEFLIHHDDAKDAESEEFFSFSSFSMYAEVGSQSRCKSVKKEAGQKLNFQNLD